MTNRVRTAIVLMVLSVGLSNCGTTNTPAPSPAGPSAAIPPTPTPPSGSVLDATLSGRVYEIVTVSPRQIAGIEGVAVYCEQCGESTHNYAYTDALGNYTFPHGVWTEGHPAFPVRIWIGKDGYKDPVGLPRPTPPNPTGPGWREVVVNGDTRFDAELVRQ